MSNNKNGNNEDVYLDKDEYTKASKLPITIARNESDGHFDILIPNPRDYDGVLSSTGKTYVLGNAVERYGKLKVSIMVTRDNK